MKTTVLGISLFNGRMRALPVVNGVAKDSWDCADLLETPDHLRAALRDAIRATQFPGDKVSFLVEDARFVHQYLQVPPMQPADLDRFLARKAEQENTFDGPAAWRYRRALKAREMDGILLDVWPQQYVDELIAVCRDVHLTPVLLLPLSAVFCEQVRSLGVEPDDVVLLARVTPTELVLMVANGDGTLFFDRFLNLGVDRQREAERVSREITRSIMFADQQFSATVGQVWISGESDQVSAERLEPFLEVPVFQSPIVPDPSFWIWISVMLPTAHSSNFIPVDIRSAPLRKAMRTATVGMVVAVAVAWVIAMSMIEVQLDRQQGIVQSMTPRMLVLENEKRQWQQRLAELTSREARAHAIAQQRDPPMAGWFLSALGDMLPSQLVLNEATITRADVGWTIQLEGTAPADLTATTTQLALLEEQLVDGAFHAQMTKSWREVWLKQLRAGGLDAADDQRSRFVIEGKIQ